MRAVVQRVSGAQVHVDEAPVSQIGTGLLVLLGVEVSDTEQDARYLAQKIARLRVFADDQGRMNLSVQDVGGEVMVISQFTLFGDARGQNRPGFTQAEEPGRANQLYGLCCRHLEDQGLQVACGVFRAHMQVTLTNDGPVTILLDSHKQF